jgi:hypothetical protein
MSLTGRLIRLYPSAFRDRWGPELRATADAAGWRSWTDLAVNVADTWLHPAIWPARSPGQRHARTAAMALMITVTGWFVAHLTTEQGAHTYALILHGCAVALLLGLALVAPLPRPAPRAVVTVLARAVRGLAVPVPLGTAVVLVVHDSGLGAMPAPLRPILLACWWGAWLLAIVQGCRVLARLGPRQVVPPSPARVRAGIRVLTAVTAVAGSTTVVFAVTAGHFAPIPALLGAVLLLATTTLDSAHRDLFA